MLVVRSVLASRRGRGCEMVLYGSERRTELPERPRALPSESRATQGKRPSSQGPRLNLLVKIGEEINSECVLLVELVAIGVFHSIQGMGRRRIFQENVPDVRKRVILHKYSL